MSDIEFYSSDQDESVRGPETPVIDEQPAKKARVEPEPSLKILVGGKEFEGHEENLRLACPYFETMLSSRMKEQATKVIEFPDKDPKEWEIVAKFFLPKSHPESEEAQITKDNVCFLIPWFHEFCLENLLVECDDVLEKKITACSKRMSERSASFIAETWMLCRTYGNLARSQAAIVNFMRRFWSSDYLESCSKNEIFETCKMLVPILEMEEHRAVWRIIARKYLPEKFQQIDLKVLNQNEMFVHLLAAEVYISAQLI